MYDTRSNRFDRQKRGFHPKVRDENRESSRREERAGMHDSLTQRALSRFARRRMRLNQAMGNTDLGGCSRRAVYVRLREIRLESESDQQQERNDVPANASTANRRYFAAKSHTPRLMPPPIAKGVL
jgi:DNA primase catalytic subunit